MDKFELIKRNTQEVVEDSELRELIKTKKKPVAYIGYAPTGKLHIGHLVPIMKAADFIKAGFEFKFLIADLHAFLDDRKTPWELLDARAKYYTECIKACFKAIGVETDNVKFVKGSSYQLEKDYFVDVLKMAGDTTLLRAKRAAAEVVRLGEEPRLGGFIYPLMQIEDVKMLKADVAFGGIDQRGIYMLGREILPAMDCQKPICVFTPLIPGLAGGKMSSSDKKSKIGLLDPEEEVKRKIKQAYCEAGKVDDNGMMLFVKNFLMTLKEDKKEEFVINRPEKFGGKLSYKNYAELEKDFLQKKIHPEDLKSAVAEELNPILEVIREQFRSKQKILDDAYPEEKA